MFFAVGSMVLLCVMIVGAWIGINPPTKWVKDKDDPKRPQ